MASDLLPTKDVAERLHVPLSTFHGWVDAGRITPALKAPGLRGALFFRPADVDKLAHELAAEGAA